MDGIAAVCAFLVKTVKTFFEHLKNSEKSVMIINIAIIVIFIIIALFKSSNGTGEHIMAQVDTDNGIIGIGGNGEVAAIEIDSISSVKNLRQIELGSVINASDYPGIYAGIYCNTEFGEYLLYADKNSSGYCVIFQNSHVTVIGMKNRKTVDDLYNQLKQLCHET